VKGAYGKCITLKLSITKLKSFSKIVIIGLFPKNKIVFNELKHGDIVRQDIIRKEAVGLSLTELVGGFHGQ
jgi:hypothetical protein